VSSAEHNRRTCYVTLKYCDFLHSGPTITLSSIHLLSYACPIFSQSISNSLAGRPYSIFNNQNLNFDQKIFKLYGCHTFPICCYTADIHQQKGHHHSFLFILLIVIIRLIFSKIGLVVKNTIS